MTQINLEKIKNQEPKSRSFFLWQSTFVIFGISIFLLFAAFFSGVFYHFILDGFLFPKLFDWNFLLILIFGLVLLFVVTVLMVSLYRSKDWKFGQNAFILFIITIFFVSGLSTFWLQLENNLQKDDQITPTRRGQMFFKGLNPVFRDENLKSFRGKIEKIDLDNKLIIIKNPEEKIVVQIPPNLIQDWNLKENQVVDILYKAENGKNIFVDIRPRVMPMNLENKNSPKQTTLKN